MPGPGEGLVIAIDGGGAKTDLALLDAAGRLHAHVRGPRSQAHYLGSDGCVAVLEELLERAAAAAGLPPARRPLAAVAQVLLAGVDVPEELTALQSAIGQRRWGERLTLGNDTEALLRAGTDRGWGIAVVCGTGINCLGRAPDGALARFLSFGDISGDWGGGTDVGVAALAAAVRADDRRGPRTALQRAVPGHFGYADATALATAVHLGRLAVAELGTLAAVVFSLADSDPAAAAIADRLADEVVAFAAAASDRLALRDGDPDVVLGGRLARMMPEALVARITAQIGAVIPRARVAVCAGEPIVGAALLGLDALGAGPGAAARACTELDAALAASAAARGEG